MALFWVWKRYYPVFFCGVVDGGYDRAIAFLGICAMAYAPLRYARIPINL
ncbi:MAG: hypothetical protein JGK01_03615 [Microcoleus sp. PH2017_03_ELD_O_A]|nr:hypothetical protein [Microcoleus sp. PH2017_03_ELD_O_A]